MSGTAAREGGEADDEPAIKSVMVPGRGLEPL